MNKPVLLYTALTKAVDDFNTRHHLCRGHLAAALGYHGENAAIQFSNALNPRNSDKTINDEKKYLLLHALDQKAVKLFFTEWMRQFSLKPVEVGVPCISIGNLETVIDDAQMESGEAFRVTKMALRDETLTKEELEAIIKENKEASEKHNEVVLLAESRLKAMKDL